MSEDDLRRVVREAVLETLTSLGISANNPHEMQADFAYMRNMREGAEFIRKSVRGAVVTVAIPSFLYAVWEVLRQALK